MPAFIDKRVKPYGKAIAAFVSAAAASALAARGVDTEAAQVITSGEWVEAGLTGLGAAAVVYFVPNRDPKGARQDESVQPPSQSYSGDSKADAAYHGKHE